MKAGAVDEEMISAGLLAQYGSDLTVDHVPTLVDQLRQTRPLLFKQDQSAAPPTAPLPQVRSSGVTTPTPQIGNDPSGFDPLDKRNSLEEVQRQFKNRTKGVNWLSQ